MSRPVAHGFKSRAAPPLSWLRFHPFLLFAGYALIGALPGQAAAAPAAAAQVEKQSPTLERMVAICKLPPEAAQRAILALPEDGQAAALLICIGYQRGQTDLIEILRGTRAKGRAI